MSAYRVIHRKEPKQEIFKALVNEFFNLNPDCDVATVSIKQDQPTRTQFQNNIYHLWVDILRKEQGEESKKEFKKDIIDRKRIKLILKNISKKSKTKNIDPKITQKIWTSMIRAFIDYEFRNFKKK